MSSCVASGQLGATAIGLHFRCSISPMASKTCQKWSKMLSGRPTVYSVMKTNPWPFGTNINMSSNPPWAVEAEEEEYFYQVEQLTFLWVLFTLIVIGNATVLIALSVSKAVIAKCLGRVGRNMNCHSTQNWVKSFLFISKQVYLVTTKSANLKGSWKCHTQGRISPFPVLNLL